MPRHQQTRYTEALTASPLLTVNDVAHLLAISRDSVYRLVREGALHPVRVGERMRFKPADIDAYLDRTGSP